MAQTSRSNPAIGGAVPTQYGVRSAVVNQTGKSVDDLPAAELAPLVEAAANKLRQMQQAQSLPRT